MEAINRFIECGDSVYTYRLEELNKRRSVVAVNEKSVPQGKSGKNKTVTVRKGDTLGGIANRNNTTVAKLKKLNNLKGTNIRVGQKLRVR